MLLDTHSLAVPVRLGRLGRMGFAIADRRQSIMHPQLVGYVLIDGAGVGQFFRHSQFRKKFQNQVGLHLQLPRKHVNTDLLHKRTECKRGDS